MLVAGGGNRGERRRPIYTIPFTVHVPGKARRMSTTERIRTGKIVRECSSAEWREELRRQGHDIASESEIARRRLRFNWRRSAAS